MFLEQTPIDTPVPELRLEVLHARVVARLAEM